ncbi:thioesterase II family protein [Flavivirga jejuensis]|uniref:Thioesterase domain-containing protein n=1 Tax=Flavivirga jejuensis TaxID=870487 RepID=A0ABT8WKF7_9FLAO|nr:thioesterase domain-containing protein [Flavivirga jejuensis]MDO5973612.1 thioesterase domain-containing protein [Flavivirga jejuensis]
MKKKQLFLLHFAGGSIYSFDFLEPFPVDFEMISIELPGRGKRIKEKLITSYVDAIQDMYKQISNRLNGEDFIIYGHSLGAALALGIEDMLEKDNKFSQCVIVSGNAGPGIKREKNRSSLNRNDFITMLKELGGLPKELLESEELLDFVLPILRADFKILEGDFLINDIIIESPIIAIMGDEEKEINKINNWKKHTKSNFKSYVLKGNHFFIYNNVKELVEIFRTSYHENKSLI